MPITFPHVAPVRTRPRAGTPPAAEVPAANPAPGIKLPETGFLRQPQVLAFVPISKSTLWRRIQERSFPQPVKLSAGITAWRAEDIRNWIAGQTARR